MNPTQARILTLEAQVNALAHAWLYLAANVEMGTGIDMERMEKAMCKKHWPTNPDIDQEARNTLQWLRTQAEEARANRRTQQAGTGEAVKRSSAGAYGGMSNVIPMHRTRRPPMQGGDQRQL